MSPRSLLLAVVATLPACDGCHEGKPYTPYTLTDPPGSASAGAQAAVHEDAGSSDAGAAPAFAVVAASTPPGDGARWPLEAGAAAPPAGHTFAQGLILDVDGDGKRDLLAWARAPDGLRGELWFASGKSPADGRLVAALPDGLASPGCNPSATLSQISATTAVLDFEPRCSGRLRERSARWIAVVRPAPVPEISLELRVGAPFDGESLQVSLDGRDRDDDGRGDLAATITLTGAPRPLPRGGTASATLAFFDRPAGLSRDPTEPEASFKVIAHGLVLDGRKKTTAPRIPASSRSARRLHALLCDDGKAVITTSAGPVRCGDVHLEEDATMAEIEAALNLGDPLAAFAALARLDAMGSHRKDVDKLVAKHLPSVAGRLARTTAAEPDIEPPPARSPVAFTPEGDILVRERARVVRVDQSSFEETPLDAPRWPVRLGWPAGDAPSWTLTAVEESCDAPTLIAQLGGGGVPLPIATPTRCAAGAPLPIDLLGGGLIAVRGEVLSLPLQSAPRPTIAESLAAAPPVELGAARSPDGHTIAVTTSRGPLVVHLKGAGRGGSARLWTMPAVDNATSCVPNNGGERIACVVARAKGVAVYDAR